MILPRIGALFDQLMRRSKAAGELALARTIADNFQRLVTGHTAFGTWARDLHLRGALAAWTVHGGWLRLPHAPTGADGERLIALAGAFADVAELRAQAVMGVSPDAALPAPVYVRLVAQTAVRQGYTAGAETAGEAGGATHKVWVRSYPAKRHRDWHDHLEGQRIPREEQFTLPGGPHRGARVDGPHDWQHLPSFSEWANCGHAVIYVVGERVGKPGQGPASGHAKIEGMQFEQIREGVNYQVLDSNLPRQQTEKILRALVQRDLFALVSRYPLKGISLQPRIIRGTARPNGLYNSGVISVATERAPQSYGNPWIPGETWSVSEAGPDLAAALRRTLVHEFGHHMMAAADWTEELVREAYNRALERGVFITEYSQANWQEYFCEALAASIFHGKSLQTYDPDAYTLVETVIGRLLGR